MYKISLNELIELLATNNHALADVELTLMVSENIGNEETLESSLLTVTRGINDMLAVLNKSSVMLYKTVSFDEAKLTINAIARKGQMDKFRNIVGKGQKFNYSYSDGESPCYECDAKDCYGYCMSAEEEKKQEEEDFTQVFEAALEESAREVAKEEVKKETEEEIDMDKETFACFEKISDFIVRFNSSKIQPILNCKYEEVPDMIVQASKEAFNKYVNNNKKQKDITKDLNAFGKVNNWVKEKKDSINTKAESNKALALLVKLGALIKAIFAKALHLMIATGKIIGKSAVVLGTLITKATVGTVVEVCKAGKAVFVLAKNEYTSAIYR